MSDRLDDLKLLAKRVLDWDADDYGDDNGRYLIFHRNHGWIGRYAGRPSGRSNGLIGWDPFVDPADAVELAEAMRKRGYGVSINCSRGGDWICTLIEPQCDNYNYFQIGSFAEAIATTVLSAVKAEVAAEVANAK